MVRSSKGKRISKYAPEEGNRYDGIYKVHWNTVCWKKTEYVVSDDSENVDKLSLMWAQERLFVLELERCKTLQAYMNISLITAAELTLDTDFFFQNVCQTILIHRALLKLL